MSGEFPGSERASQNGDELLDMDMEEESPPPERSTSYDHTGRSADGEPSQQGALSMPDGEGVPSKPKSAPHRKKPRPPGEGGSCGGLTQLPLQRVKNMMRANERIAAITTEAAVLTTKATEVFIEWMAKTAYAGKSDKDRKRGLVYNDITPCMESYPAQLEFCKDLLPMKKPKWDHLGLPPPKAAPKRPSAPKFPKVKAEKGDKGDRGDAGAKVESKAAKAAHQTAGGRAEPHKQVKQVPRQATSSANGVAGGGRGVAGGGRGDAEGAPPAAAAPAPAPAAAVAPNGDAQLGLTQAALAQARAMITAAAAVAGGGTGGGMLLPGMQLPFPLLMMPPGMSGDSAGSGSAALSGMQGIQAAMQALSGMQGMQGMQAAMQTQQSTLQHIAALQAALAESQPLQNGGAVRGLAPALGAAPGGGDAIEKKE